MVREFEDDNIGFSGEVRLAVLTLLEWPGEERISHEFVF